MVGSGFSQNAVVKVPGAAPPPNWSGLVRAMQDKLYPAARSRGKKGTLATTDALAMAQQYRTAFGRDELHRFLRQQIRDEHIAPGDFHVRLLSLPWKDVFTTNWDTLLERTCDQVISRAYDIVREIDEIPLASPPRIIKLHGSLPANFPLIVTEEDYRKYPVCFAPFVNTVQQGMMETVFLLIGFSGRDPNFLHWSGWVRDQLGSSAPQIYAAGWLNLSIHERRVLERRNVIPIDLANHPRARSWDKQSRHRLATEWILRTLELGKPYPAEEWPKVFQRPDRPTPTSLKPLDETPWNAPLTEKSFPPDSESEDATKSTDQQLSIWSHNRTHYPGWLSIPANRLLPIALVTKRWQPTLLQSLERLDTYERLNAIREVLWRHTVTLNTIGAEFARAAKDALIDAIQQGLVTDPPAEAAIEVALALVTHARFNLHEEEFDEAITRVETFFSQDPEVANQLQHEKCLLALWNLDFDRLHAELDAWNPYGADPFWIARKAAILVEVGHDDDARSLLRAAINLLRNVRSASPTIPIFSRLAWANYLLNALQYEPWDEADESYHSIMRDLRRFNCDPEDDIQRLTRDLIQHVDEVRGPPFNLGQRRATQPTIRFQEYSVSGAEALRSNAAQRAIRLAEVAALPPAAGRWSFTAHILANAAKVMNADGQVGLALRLMLRITNNDGDDLLKTLLSRPRLAAMPLDLAESMADLCLRLVDYFIQQTTAERRNRSAAVHPIDRVRVSIESLSRFVLRLQPDRAADIFAKALSYYRVPTVTGNVLVHDAIRNLLQRTWETLPPERRTDFVFDVMNSPIVGVDGFFAEPFRFEDPGNLIEYNDPPLPKRNDETEARWRETVRFLLHSFAFGREARSRAMLRLVSVAMAGRLSDSEKLLVAQAIWDPQARAVHGLPAEDSLRHWVFLCMPEPQPGTALAWFRETWVSIENTSTENDELSVESALYHLGDAIERSNDHDLDFELTPADEIHVVQLIRQWSEIPVPPVFNLQLAFFNHKRANSIRNAVHGITKLIIHIDVPRELAEALYAKQVQLFDAEIYAMPLLVGLSKTLPDRIDDIAATFRKGLSSEDEFLVYNTTHAMQAWLYFAQRGTVNHPPADLIQEIGFAIATRRHPAVRAALGLAKWLFESGGRADQESLRQLTVEGLGFLVHELDYSNTEYANIDAIPDMRWNCVAIARAMHDGGDDDPIIQSWLRLAQEDPLPEVRHVASAVAM